MTGLSVRLFGMNSWSVMAPQALMGVAAVAVLYCSVRRAFPNPNHGAAAGLLAGAVLAGTPAAALMFRFNNPDALLVLLLTVAAYCLMRAAMAASWRWLVAVGIVMGTAFLTKMLQGAAGAARFRPCLPVRRADVLGQACASSARCGRRAHRRGRLVGAGGAADPGDPRPYIRGSTDNTVLDLALGYNGINRLLGHRREGTPLGDWGGSSMPTLGGSAPTAYTGCSPARWPMRLHGSSWWRCSSSRSGCT